MIRFVDLTDPGVGAPICAFLGTVDNKFMETPKGNHTFSTMKEIEETPFGDRLLGLVPEGFFERVNGMNKYRFHWLDGSVDEGYGRNVADAFTRLGYGAGALAALDYHEGVK
jgi:hypothetical protein